MQLINKFNKGFINSYSNSFLLCVIDVFSIYAWVLPLKNKKGPSIVDAFQKILDKSMELHSGRKPNKIWVDKGILQDFFKKWLKDNDVEMYSIHNSIHYNSLSLT